MEPIKQQICQKLQCHYGQYAKVISTFDSTTYPEPSSLFPGSGYVLADYDEVVELGQPGHRIAPIKLSGTDQIGIDLRGGKGSAIMYSPIMTSKLLLGNLNLSKELL